MCQYAPSTIAILGLGWERTAEVATLRAFGKLLWLQNDLIDRHYRHAARVGTRMGPLEFEQRTKGL